MQKSRLLILAAALAAATLTARLGFWQLDRATQKEALQEADDRQRRLPPLPARDLASDAPSALAQRYRLVSLEGRWLARHTIFLDNRQMAGRVGFFVVTPLLLPDGSAVAVQRGWQPRDLIERTRTVMPPTPDDAPVTVQGRIAPPPSRLYEFAGAEVGPIRQNVDLDSFSREVGRPLRPISILQEDGPVPPADGLSRQWVRPAADVHKHYGYAFQWFALCVLIVGLYAWFQVIRPRRARRA
jgi:surfeit locus 1 family protein